MAANTMDDNQVVTVTGKSLCNPGSEPFCISGQETSLGERPAEDKAIASEISDETLMIGVCNGDREALGCLYRRYARAVRSIGYKVLRDAFEADDFVNEIFLLVHRKSAAFDSSRGCARSWILQMAYHRAITRRRYLSCRHFYNRIDLDDAPEAQLSDPQHHGETVEKAIDLKLGSSELHNLLSRLSEDQQKTLRLHFFEGYTLDEIATQLGQNIGNVRHHYFRGLEKLREHVFRNPSPFMTTMMHSLRGS